MGPDEVGAVEARLSTDEAVPNLARNAGDHDRAPTYDEIDYHQRLLKARLELVFNVTP